MYIYSQKNKHITFLNNIPLYPPNINSKYVHASPAKGIKNVRTFNSIFVQGKSNNAFTTANTGAATTNTWYGVNPIMNPTNRNAGMDTTQNKIINIKYVSAKLSGFGITPGIMTFVCLVF